MLHNERAKALDKLTEDWKTCIRCPLGEQAYKHVLWELPEGQTRADVLFIGEGPGKSEDTTGKPFIGPAGRFLRNTIAEAKPEGITYAFSNLVACRPSQQTEGEISRDRAPVALEVSTCSPRLEGLIRTLDPFVIVALGRVTEEYVRPLVKRAGFTGSVYYWFHPSYLNRNGGKAARQYPDYLQQFADMFHDLRTFKANHAQPRIRIGSRRYAKFPLYTL